MSDTSISQAAAAASLDAVVDLLDVGGAGYIEIRDGTQPANVDTAATGTLLATLPLSTPAFGAATVADPSVATANAITADSSADASASPDATWFRAFSGGGTPVIDGDISTSAAGTGDLQLDDTAIVAGGTVTVTAWTVSKPAS